MSAKICLSAEDFKRTLKAIITICFRYNVICDKNPNDQDAPFNALAISIYENGYADLSLLDKIYIEDNAFERAFSEKTFPYNSRNAKVIRYILGAIDSSHGSQLEIDPSNDSISVEHILPHDFIEKWDIDESKGNKMVDRLGNMSLLERDLNKKLQNEDYATKLPVYSRSAYLSSKELSEKYPEAWTEDTIVKRQQQMAKVAKTIWRK